MGSIASNLAEKFSPKVQESFKKGAFTQSIVNNDYDFIGVKTIKIYSVDTVPMTNYLRTQGVASGSRYGTIQELQTNVQEMEIKVDRAFSFVIDKLDNDETMGILNPGRALQRQIEERVVPEVDKYRIAKILNDVKPHSSLWHEVNGITKENAYTTFLDAVTDMLNKSIPMAGTFAYITPAFYKKIRLDGNFIKASDIAQDMLIKGQVGMIDGIPLVLVPESYFPTEQTKNSYGDHLTTLKGASLSTYKFEFMLVNRAATVGAQKLVEYKVHDNPPGVNGWLVEGRLVYDAFVLDKKKDMIYAVVNKNPSAQ